MRQLDIHALLHAFVDLVKWFSLFILQVRLLTQVRHPNLVTLEGFCHESDQQILVYEYLPGRSLADNLYGMLNLAKSNLAA